MNAIATRSGEDFKTFYEILPEQFTTREVMELSERLCVSRPTIYYWLRKLQDNGLILRVRFGEYVKLEDA